MSGRLPKVSRRPPADGWRGLARAVGVVATVGACAGPQVKVQRLQVEAVTDLSGRWNDTDSRLTAEALIGQCFAGSWREDFRQRLQRPPAVRVREVHNQSDEHIDAQLFIKSIERAMVASGQVTVLAQAGSELAAMEAEQLRMLQGHQADNSPVAVGREQGADFVVAVRLGSVLDQIEGAKAKLYQVDFELVDAASGRKVWIGEHQIKKLVTQKRQRW